MGIIGSEARGPHGGAAADEPVKARQEGWQSRPRRGICREATEDQLVEGNRNVLAMFSSRGWRFPQLRKGILLGSFGKWKFPGEQLVQRDAQAKDVCRWRDAFASAFFGSDIGVRARRVGRPLAVLRACRPEIEQDGSAMNHDDVRRLDVQV